MVSSSFFFPKAAPSKDFIDLLDGKEADEVLDIVYMHQVVDKASRFTWLLDIKRQLAESVLNVAADVGIECENIHCITSGAIWMLDVID